MKYRYFSNGYHAIVVLGMNVHDMKQSGMKDYEAHFNSWNIYSPDTGFGTITKKALKDYHEVNVDVYKFMTLGEYTPKELL